MDRLFCPTHSERPTLKTCPTPPARSLTDAALFASSEESSPAAKRTRNGQGVVPASGATISLGESRFCNSATAPAESTTPLVALLGWTSATLYHQPAVQGPAPDAPPRNVDNLTRGRFNGYMSPATRRVFKRTASTWLRSIFLFRASVRRQWSGGRAYPTFATLTLPAEQVHSDREIYRECLMPLLTLLRREHGLEQYVWRAEAQENGRLHYHLILDRYVDKRTLQFAWNMCLDRLGYRHRYFVSTGSFIPPTTEIHGLRSTRINKHTGAEEECDPVDYLCDYLCEIPQEEQGPPDPVTGERPPVQLVGYTKHADGTRTRYVTRPIRGRVWGMSDALRKVQPPKCAVTPDLLRTLSAAAAAGTLRRVDTEHATLFFGPVVKVLEARSPRWSAMVRAYFLQVFGSLYGGQLPTEYLRRHPPLDMDGLWLDFQAEGYTYPPSWSERYDEWSLINSRPTGSQLAYTANGVRLLAPLDQLYRRHRFARKRSRMGLDTLAPLVPSLT